MELKERLKSILGGSCVEDGAMADNLAVVLCTYFEKHVDCPEDDPVDQERGWGEWAIKKYEQAIELIAIEIINSVLDKIATDQLNRAVKFSDLADKYVELLERINTLQNVYRIQVGDPSSRREPYMQGLANGLIMAMSVMKGIDPEFIKIEKPDQVEVDAATGSAMSGFDRMNNPAEKRKRVNILCGSVPTCEEINKALTEAAAMDFRECTIYPLIDGFPGISEYINESYYLRGPCPDCDKREQCFIIQKKEGA